MKTKRFLFFTGGSDSTLILRNILKLISGFTSTDELVVLMYASDSLRSGQQEKLEKSIEVLSRVLSEMGLCDNENLMKRVSVLVVKSEILTTPNDSMVCELEREDGSLEKFKIKHASHDHKFLPYVKSLFMQESLLISTIPQVVPYLGACKNVFYMGCCGTDIATRNTARLKEVFDTTFACMTAQKESNSLDLEMIKAGIPSMGRAGGNYLNPDWIPTLEFPLQDLQKKDVLLLLENEKCQSYIVEKVENLVEHYSVKDPVVYAKTQVYHKAFSEAGYPEEFPTYDEFLTTGTLPGKTPEEVNELVKMATASFIFRVFGI